MFAAFIDIETSGSDEHNDDLLEFGMAVVDLDRPADILIFGKWLIKPTIPLLDVMGAADPIVLDMHRANGLWADLEAGLGENIDDVDLSISLILENLRLNQDGEEQRKIALAGSGVGHFDSRWIRYRMPRTAKHLTYWTLDVGVLRRACKYAGRPDLVLEGTADKTHRALDDALFHHQEWLHYRAVLAGAMLPVPDDPFGLEAAR